MNVFVTSKNKEDPNKNEGARVATTLNEPPCGKTNNLHRQKQRRRSASR